MIYSNPSISKTLTVFTLAGTMSIATCLGASAQSRIQFNAPTDAAPTDTTGGGIRGNVQFLAPTDATPTDTTGGGIRGEEGFLPPDNATPNTSMGSGTRGAAPTQMVPLLPPAKYGRTIAARPTMLVYVPPTQTSQKVFFSVQDENRQNLYQTTLELPGEGGIIRVTLPESAPELELGKTYTWFFAPVPSEGFLRPDNYGVVGWVKRVEPTMEIPAAGSFVDRAAAYAASGVWYDTLNLVASAQQSQPNDPTLSGEWEDLLQQVGLEAVADQPLTRSF
ncbi:MAG: DUF928 domain-containing protein [Geitlerinemataceae cyanobacterium]